MGSRLSVEMPTKLKTASSHAVVSPDKLSVTYADIPCSRVGAVQANNPVCVEQYYFEMKVKNCFNSQTNCLASIGFTPEGFDLSTHLGCKKHSVGYHGDDGFIYVGGVKSTRNIGAKFTTDDIVGAGLNYASKEFYFTKNGEVVGTVSMEINDPLFPTVAVYGPNEVKVNFGYKSFVYNTKVARDYCPYCRQVNIGSQSESESESYTTYEKSWNKLMEEKVKLMEKLVEQKEKEKEVEMKEKLLKEKKKELDSLKAAVLLKTLIDDAERIRFF
ncbi:Ran-binding protein M homolog [Linum perenne]